LLTNWNSIPLETICSDPEKTISDIFNQLSTVPTLKISFWYDKFAFVPLSIYVLFKKKTYSTVMESPLV